MKATLKFIFFKMLPYAELNNSAHFNLTPKCRFNYFLAISVFLKQFDTGTFG